MLDGFTDFAVRAAGDPRSLIMAIQKQVWAIDKDQPVTNVKTLDEVISDSVAQRRFQMLLLVLFAGLGLVFAWLLRCRLYPGKKPFLPTPRATDDCFVLVLEEPDSAAAADKLDVLLRDQGAVYFAPSPGDGFGERGE